MKSDEEINKILMLSLNRPYVEFKSSDIEADRQKVYRMRRKMADDAPLLAEHEITVRTRDKEWIVLEWKESGPLEINTDKPLEINTEPPKEAKKMPKWLAERLEDFKTTRETAAANPEFKLAWMDLDTLVIACERLAEITAAGGEDADLEKFVRTANLDYLDMAFRGGVAEFSHLETIEVLRQAIAEIPVDDSSREQERTDLIKRRERLMLERDKRLDGTDPLI